MKHNKELQEAITKLNSTIIRLKQTESQLNRYSLMETTEILKQLKEN